MLIVKIRWHSFLTFVEKRVNFFLKIIIFNLMLMKIQVALIIFSFIYYCLPILAIPLSHSIPRCWSNGSLMKYVDWNSDVYRPLHHDFRAFLLWDFLPICSHVLLCKLPHNMYIWTMFPSLDIVLFRSIFSSFLWRCV